MKSFCIHSGNKSKSGGFSLTEVTFSIGVISFGFLSLTPLLVLGLKEARLARNERVSSQIAQGLIEQARQGTPAAGTVYLDEQGSVLPSALAAAFTAQSSSQAEASGAALTQFTLRITPSGMPDHIRVYAVVYPTPATAAH